MIHYWPFWIAGASTAVVGFVLFRRTPSGRQTWDWVKINMPIFGTMVRKVAISRSLRTLGAMIGAGVPVLDAMRLCADVSNNYFYEQLWQRVQDQVATGKRICEALAGSPLFPPMLVQMISTGEETGKLDKVLQRVSGFYDQEVEASLKTTDRNDRADHDFRHGRGRRRHCHVAVAADLLAQPSRGMRENARIPAGQQTILAICLTRIA